MAPTREELLAVIDRQRLDIERLQARVGVRPRLELVAQGTIPRTEFKARRVVDDRDLYRKGVSGS